MVTQAIWLTENGILARSHQRQLENLADLAATILNIRRTEQSFPKH